MRYVDFMEINGGREIANYALDRATQIFLKVFLLETMHQVLGELYFVLQCRD